MPTPHLPVCIAGSEDAACEAQEMTVIAMNAAVQVALTANRESSLSRMQARREGELSKWAYACLLGILRMQALRS